ncbi:hypothetical protein MB46_15045 [Arthrobacter alpinus]|nr:hypothetical protein [Arthrobacter alpinus]ALV46612.1 hypothetical protein MB46_15045 [Arthrobacter alpinus]
MGRIAGKQSEEPNALHIPTSRQKSGEDFDIIIGFLGFWAVVLFGVTLWLELTGEPALIWALGLLLVCLGLWGMIRLRRKLPARRDRRSQ